MKKLRIPNPNFNEAKNSNLILSPSDHENDRIDQE